MPEDLRPKNRSALRLACGTAYYTARRYAYWAFGGVRFAKTQQEQPLGWRAAAHSTPLLRKLKDVDMQYQYNRRSATGSASVIRHAGKVMWTG